MANSGAKDTFCVIIALWLIFSQKVAKTFEIENSKAKWPDYPSLISFENYEEKEKCINGKKIKNSKKLDNPLDDTYINAYNFYREVQERLQKFVEEPNRKLETSKRMNVEQLFHSKKTKRFAQRAQPELIKFDVADAKEPDEAVKESIRRGRAREMTAKKLSISTTITPNINIRKAKHKNKRARRSAPNSQPQFIRFELEDARQPDNDLKLMINEWKEREMRSNLAKQLMNTQSNENQQNEDSAKQESNRFIFYQTMPLKFRRAINSVPVEVQKVIDTTLEARKAQAYYNLVSVNSEAIIEPTEKVKHIYGIDMPLGTSAPTPENLVTVYPQPAYEQKFTSVSNVLPLALISPSVRQQPQGRGPRALPLLLPEVVNKPQFYFPSQHQHTGPIYHHLQPTSYLNLVPALSQNLQAVSIPTATQKQQQPKAFLAPISSRPINYENMHTVQPMHLYGKNIDVNTSAENQETYLATDESLNEIDGGQKSIYQQKGGGNVETDQQIPAPLQEFQELSALVGRLPSDQIDGLAFLLAKEMQRNMHLKLQRPQQNTSPILFHTNNAIRPLSHDINLNKASIANSKPDMSPDYVAESPLKEYTPIVEHNTDLNVIAPVNTETNLLVTPLPPSSPSLATSFKVINTLGLSPNYKTIENLNVEAGSNSDDNQIQYASKYAFGYRVHDFHSGNDYGHKQNQDPDGVTRGQYHILLPDGRIQNVIYQADKSGFHADVRFEARHD